MKKSYLKYIFLVIIAIILSYFFIDSDKEIEADSESSQIENVESIIEPEPVVEKKIEVAVEAGEVFSNIGEKAGLTPGECYEIYDKTREAYDLAKIKAGNTFQFFPDENDKIYKFIYPINYDEELIVERHATSSEWCATVEPIVYEIKEKLAEGTIDRFLYIDALDKGYDERAILEFAQSLEWSIDFANDPRVGDKYKFIYEERYRDGKYIMPGNILAGAYLNNGKLLESFYFEESEENKGYFDADGNSVQKMFLKAPLSFRYISSGFTTGRRYVAAFNVSTGHRAIDYAATAGTPIRAVGDGTVTFAGWSSAGYGNLTTIRHNGTYSTNYAHQSKFAVKKGQRVKQGDIIGYVGSTGFSTGPHLHYEMVKNGVKINPMYEILPPGEPIGKEKLPEFLELVEEMRDKIKINI